MGSYTELVLISKVGYLDTFYCTATLFQAAGLDLHRTLYVDILLLLHFA